MNKKILAVVVVIVIAIGIGAAVSYENFKPESDKAIITTPTNLTHNTFKVELNDGIGVKQK